MCTRKATELLRNVHHSPESKASPHQSGFPNYSDQAHCLLQSELNLMLKTSTWASNIPNSVLLGTVPATWGSRSLGETRIGWVLPETTRTRLLTGVCKEAMPESAEQMQRGRSRSVCSHWPRPGSRWRHAGSRVVEDPCASRSVCSWERPTLLQRHIRRKLLSDIRETQCVSRNENGLRRRIMFEQLLPSW